MLGVDILGAAVEEAQRNTAVNRLGHCSYITGNVEDAVPRMVQAAKHEEVSNSIYVRNLKLHLKSQSPFTHWLYKVVAIVDPPRAGLSEKAVQQLRSSRVNKLIFVSSDPKATIR